MVGIHCINGRATGIVLEGMELKRMISFDALIRFSKLSILSFKNNALQGGMMNFSGNQKSACIDLSGNKFQGPISEPLLSLALLASLQLQNNNLTGQIPSEMQIMFKQSTLSVVALSMSYEKAKKLKKFKQQYEKEEKSEAVQIPIIQLEFVLREPGTIYHLMKATTTGGRGSKERVPFRWNSRLSAAQGVARTLHYLHVNSKSRPNVIVPHGNLKSTNVLLAQDDAILVSDYGLSSLVTPPIAVKSMVCVKSPEYRTRQLICPKADVRSYGCLLLELLTDRVCANAAPPGVHGVDLCSWVHRAEREEWTAEIFDSEIRKQRRLADSMLELLQIAIRCCDESPDSRPEMAEIVQEIENMKVADDCEEEFVTSSDDIVQSSW
ncbi:probable LRR receptor-like serine/threonine-protein kinase At4g31250 [Eucalyptus grandis]|uniref:probable LRR receptor-like serine/threonine-protein kinase At4g31250 n=1 Tax=Eucalyptus grandis TaxID=71139 RepID=UPI00192E903F|nr:probable LRR receptor-like serine/threonine-protein kinase At4g31250 [Eucalyptus grandis]